MELDLSRSYWLARFAMLRLLGLISLIAFSIFLLQGPALIGEHGLLPADSYVRALVSQAGSPGRLFWELPTLFAWGVSDRSMLVFAGLGAVLAAAAMLGFSNALTWLAQWVLYLSLDHVGQAFWGFGWENQLLETMVLAAFISPLLDPRPFPATAPPIPLVWLFRWLTFRIMLGAGLIKLRGDSCWRDLTCLDFHFETQPVPNPITPFFHFLPHSLHAAGVVFNFVAEVGAPFFLFGPKQFRRIAGAVVIAFQLTLIVSGNLSFLNWLTLVPAIACFDDALLGRLVFPRLALRAKKAAMFAEPNRGQTVATRAFAAVIGVLSIQPVLNLLSSHQAMNTNHDPFELVNSYGAFGSVGRERYELVLEGTRDGDPTDATWTPYAFKCKPTALDHRPCWMSPFHYHLDWQIWFAAMGSVEDEPWMLHLIAKLLKNDPLALGLMGPNPFPGEPPRWIRVKRYRYHLQWYSDPTWWTRDDESDWLPPLSAEDPRLTRALEAFGWN